MGVGDWNDGMNKVGHKGKGESVWVGMFLYDIINKFKSIMEYMEEPNTKIYDYIKENDKLLNALSTTCFDGSWYLRAFYDDGTPMGSKNNEEGEIDLLVQSWSILTNVADPIIQKKVIEEVEARLVDKKSGIIKLLTPPFTSNEKNPGYISYYLKGVRENGGQYTHAALWYIKALLKYGEKNRAFEYYSMINPMNRDIETYKTEPYVIAADIYSNKAHKGRGGWTWYTGSAGWAYKIAVEDIIGLEKRGNILNIRPNIPDSWNEFKMEYKYETTIYKINVARGKSNMIKLDGNIVEEILLTDDKIVHNVEVVLGERND
jgi:cellobiose phosphorylase